MAQTTPHTDDLFAEIGARHPVHARFMAGARVRLTEVEQSRLEKYLGFCRSRGLTGEDIASAYLTIVNDTVREQMFFRKHGRYRYSSFAEVADQVYFDPDYMARYMYGLAISSFLWPNHLDMLRFFQETLPAGGGRYLEIGPGHGYYLLTALQKGAYEEVLAVDISATSIDQTRAILSHFAPDIAPRARIEQVDFLDCELPSQAFATVVMGEVLEHVEQPAAFLQRIREVARSDAHVFVTTCINAPAVDHITLFEAPEALETLFGLTGFRIEKQLIRPYDGKTLAQSLADRLPINVAYVLAPA